MHWKENPKKAEHFNMDNNILSKRQIIIIINHVLR